MANCPESSEGYDPSLTHTIPPNQEIRLVVNYDCPETSEGYVHRIGRTGRAGETGIAHTLITKDDARVSGDLVRVCVYMRVRVCS